jgi:uncharacterized protein (TIGR03086 family)
MDAKTLFEQCLDQATDIIMHATPAHYSDATPDTEWNVRKLIGHMLYELSWVPAILDGKTAAQVGDTYDGDLIGTELQTHWQTAAQKAREAVHQADVNRTIHLSYGDFPALHYIREQANDQYIHAWDLGSALGLTITFNTAIAETLYRAALPRKDELATSGLFAPALDVPDSAGIQTKLLALFGRNAS